MTDLFESRRQPLPWEGVPLSGDLAVPSVWLTRPQVNDSVRKVHTLTDIATWRALAIYYVWGFAGMPTWSPTVTHAVASPLTSCPNLDHVDQLSYIYNATSATGLAIQVHLYAWHFVPSTSVKNRLVIYSPGHSTSFNDDETASPSNLLTGDWRMISSLVAAGFDVVVYDMPAYCHDADPTSDGTPEANWHADTGAVPFPYTTQSHEWLAQFTPHYPSIGSFLRFFLTMPTLCLNYAQALGRFSNLNAVGLSGGGWSTTLLSALDTRIARSYSVAGSQPIYMRPATGALGDAEQVWPEFYSGCGYLDLYLMATSGGRHAEQIYNYSDDTVFGAAQYAAVESGRVRCNGLTYAQAIADFSGEISTAAASVTGGTFATSIDLTSTQHQNSWQTCGHVVSDLG